MKIITDIDSFIEENNISRIYVDWDGVLTHSCQAIVDIGNEMFGTNAKGEDVLEWNFSDVFPKLKESDMEKLFDTDSFFEKLQWIDGAVDFLKRYKDIVVIVTKAVPNNFIGKVNMLKSVGLEDISIIPIPFKEDKGIIDMFFYKNNGNSLFIDDNIDNLWDATADIKVCFAEYNDDKVRKWQNLKLIPNDGYVMYKW